MKTKAKEKAIEWIRAIPLPVVYVVLTVLIGLAYMPARTIMIKQETAFNVILSNVTLNLVLLYGIWGLFIDKATKSKPRWFGWTVFFIGLAVLTLVFRFLGGMETIIG